MGEGGGVAGDGEGAVVRGAVDEDLYRRDAGLVLRDKVLVLLGALEVGFGWCAVSLVCSYLFALCPSRVG